MDILNYSIWEVESQSNVDRVDISDDVSTYGFEPECNLFLREPDRFSTNNLVARLSGKAALHQFKKGDLVAVRLRYWRVKKNHEYVTRITIEDIKLVRELKKLFL
jgi:hypothetical protein